MNKKWAISWLIPAVCILLLHTLIPHVHNYTLQNNNNQHSNCQHKKHGVWEFLEHLATQDVGSEHLENYQNSIKKQVFNKKIAFANTTSTLFININNHTIINFTNNCSFNNSYLFPKNSFLKTFSLRGPPTF
jgi:hypothetical protein